MHVDIRNVLNSGCWHLLPFGERYVSPLGFFNSQTVGSGMIYIDTRRRR